MEKVQILVVEDDANMRFVLAECLRRNGYDTMLAVDGLQALDIFTARAPDLVLLDLKIPKMNGMEVLERVKEASPQTFVIMLTGYATVNVAVESMKKGAHDFITKPFEVEELMLVVENAVEKIKVIKENQKAKQQAFAVGIDVYHSEVSPGAQKVEKMVESAALTDYTIMLEGESGTGKSLIAQEIHERSSRKEGPFVRVDCAALPSNLIESELFGYERGAFTGAVNRKIGKIERANGGTLFLDEISTLSFNGQAALLSVIQNREFERVGGTAPQQVDVRIIAASNQNLKQMVKDKLFRHDLYYRLKVFTIVLPPLRERPEDIIPLAYFFINKYDGSCRGLTLSADAAMKLKSYDWPGNIRELENAIKHALILLGNEDTILSKHLPLELNQGYWAFREQNLGLKEIMETTERSVIQQALLENDYNIEKSARALKMSKRTLYYRINKLGMDLSLPNTMKNLQ